MSFPVFVRAKDSGEVWSFDSIVEIQAQFEEIDIQNEEYEAWDKDGLPVRLRVHTPALWIVLEPSTEAPKPVELRRAIAEYVRSMGVVLPDALEPSGFIAALDRVRTEHERVRQAKSWIRRLVARFR